ncbi:hypothetical protein CVT26_004313, partial [Gymnopilus dilepis]
INSGSENEASDSDAAPRPGRAFKNTTPISDSEDDEGADESALSEVEDVEDDDLMNFDSEVRPIFADDQDVGGLELELTTASEIDLTIGAGLEDEDEDEDEAAVVGPKVSEAESHEGSRDVNAKWPEHEAYYVPARSLARIISVRGQPEPLRNVIKAAIRMVTGDLIFKNVYICDVGINDYYKEVVMKCAKELNYQFLHDRFESDHRFCVVVGRLLAGRVSLFRSNIKKLTNAGVQGFYQLGTGDECQKCAGRQLVWRTKPSKHPAIISTLHQVLASGGGGRALVHKHAKRFASIIKKGPRRGEELEMPIPIVALIATYVYLGHVETLENIRRNSPDKCHRLMADIYSSVCRGTSARTVAVSHGALSILDLDGMDE